MKRLLFWISVGILTAQPLRAQEYASSLSLSNPVQDGPFFALDDSIPQPPKRNLLPANISFMEKDMWGENGVLRGIGLAAPLTPEVRKAELTLRRSMLTGHFIGGLATMGFMTTAAYFGQKIIDGHPEYRKNHQLFVTASIISYSATGLLAVLAPPPIIRRDEASSITVHKTLAWVHFAGMVITPILGSQISRRSTSSQVARFHQVSVYVTLTAFTAAMISLTF